MHSPLRTRSQLHYNRENASPRIAHRGLYLVISVYISGPRALLSIFLCNKDSCRELQNLGIGCSPFCTNHYLDLLNNQNVQD